MNAEGPDFSYWNPNNDWDILGPSEACNIAGMRSSYGKGKDPTFPNNFVGAGRFLIIRIVYHFFAARVSVIEQYNAFMSAIGDERDFIVALDFEALQQMDPIEAAKLARQWINMVQAHFPPGRVIVYTNLSLAAAVYSVLGDLDLWIAWPITVPDPDPAHIYPMTPGGWQRKPILWQYTWTRGDVPGVPDQTIDWNVSYMQIEEFAQHFGIGSAPAPDPEPQPAAGLVMRVVQEGLKIRSGPVTSYPEIGQLHEGDLITPVDIAGSSAWIQFVLPDGRRVWANVEYFGDRNMEPGK